MRPAGFPVHALLRGIEKGPRVPVWSAAMGLAPADHCRLARPPESCLSPVALGCAAGPGCRLRLLLGSSTSDYSDASPSPELESGGRAVVCMVETSLYFGKTKTGSVIHLARTGEDWSLCGRDIAWELEPTAVGSDSQICPRCREAREQTAQDAREAAWEALSESERMARSDCVEERDYAPVLALLEAAEKPKQYSRGIKYVRELTRLDVWDLVSACEAVRLSRRWFLIGDRVARYAAGLLRKRRSDPICELMLSTVDRKLVRPIMRYHRFRDGTDNSWLDHHAGILCGLLASQALWDRSEGHPLLAEFLGEQWNPMSRDPASLLHDPPHDHAPPVMSSRHPDVRPSEGEPAEPGDADDTTPAANGQADYTPWSHDRGEPEEFSGPLKKCVSCGGPTTAGTGLCVLCR